MATFTAVRNKKQTAGTMRAVVCYVTQLKKVSWDGAQLVSGHNCVPASALTEMQMTKERFRKTGGRQFYHFVQSFSPDDDLTPQEVNALGLELARREFPDYEVLVATHVDANCLHNHLVVNSVSCADGRKLHQNTEDLIQHRRANDEICLAFGLDVLEQPRKHERKKRMKPGEYQAGIRGESWKMDLIHTINEALEYAMDRETFIENMEQEGYGVIWTDARKHITFLCPDGHRCRDSSLHDETFLKENLEALFAYRQAVGFTPGTEEPDMGWLGEAAMGLIQIGRRLEQMADRPPLPSPPVWTDSKQRRREALKKLAMGHKFGGWGKQNYTVNMY